MRYFIIKKPFFQGGMWQFFPRTTSLWYVGGEHVIWSKLIQDHACYYTAHENIEGIEFWKFLPALGVEPPSNLVAPPTHKCSIRHYVVLTQVGTAEAMAVQFSEVSYCWLASVRYRVWYGNIQCIRTHVNRLPCGCDYAFNNWHFWLMFYTILKNFYKGLYYDVLHYDGRKLRKAPMETDDHRPSAGCCRPFHVYTLPERGSAKDRLTLTALVKCSGFTMWHCRANVPVVEKPLSSPCVRFWIHDTLSMLGSFWRLHVQQYSIQCHAKKV